MLEVYMKNGERHNEGGMSLVRLAVGFVLLFGVVAVGVFIVTMQRIDSSDDQQGSNVATETVANSQAAAKQQAQVLIQSAYNQYLKDIGTGGDALKPFTESTSYELAQRLMATAQSSSYDPVLCVQNKPQKLVFGSPVIDGRFVTVPVEATFAEGSQKISVLASSESNKITAISCV